MLKKLVLGLVLILFISFNCPANAGYFADKKNQLKTSFQVRSDKRQIKKLIKLQNDYAQMYDYENLAKLYRDDFKSSDGFDKDVYFKLITETWQAYPDITYTTDIRSISVDKNTASVEVYETSLATTVKVEEGVEIYGELHSSSDGVYHLKKDNNKWLISSETVNSEKSFLKYGDLRFVDFDLKSPKTVKAGEYYTASLTVDTPEDALIVASIGKDNIAYPQEKSDEVFRRLPDDNLLERMFLANKDGKNEYNVASVAMTKSQTFAGKLNLYIAGIGFVMNRVNVESTDEN